ncbi:transcription factor HHO2-like [Cornus florida]|uniref:transcription factor HHO2-like n=1 Tax=Cornus florida TaxID=4283 RepID=UPI0028A1C068|nr:transcription factor HHO2-like [Cornus florida]
MDNNYTEKMQRFRDYIEALEEERRKIQVFRSELPLCLELVTQAIDTWKKQLSGTTPTTTMELCIGQSECSEQTSTDGPVLEELFPVKKSSSSDEEEQSQKPINNRINQDSDNKKNEKLTTKSDWLRSVQLWNQTPDQPIKEDTPRKVSVIEVKGNLNGCGAFQPFKREKMGGSPCAVAPSATTSSTAETGGSSGGGGGDDGSKREQKGGGQSLRKERRCWSPELHRRFLHALQQLGGSHVATPKQIRELMKVDGLTNDEVKSHLQKYRLHTRRPSSSSQNSNPQAPQFVVVGGIWVPPPAVASTTASGEEQGVATSHGIYAPIAAPPPPPPPQKPPLCLPQVAEQSKQLHSDERSSDSEGRAHSNSRSTSSSTHTTTASSVLVPVV